MHICFVFKTFKDKKDSSHHFKKYSNTGPHEVSVLFSRLTITVSSTNFNIWQFSKVLQQSYVYNMYNRGDRTHPWGEPVDVTDRSENCPFTLTLWVLHVRKSKIQPAILPFRPKYKISCLYYISLFQVFENHIFSPYYLHRHQSQKSDIGRALLFLMTAFYLTWISIRFNCKIEKTLIFIK